ncbi:MAG: C45 family autoproteolytic acyltransferase/hydrolase [Candidatus Hermodarchaeota archaeon]
MGSQMGKILKGRLNLPRPDEKRLRYAKECEAAVKIYAPDLLEELIAVAEASETDIESMKAIFLTFGVEPGCSIVAVSGEHTNDGKTLFGRNYDMFPHEQEWFTVLILQPTERFDSMQFTDHFVGTFCGVNEAGLGVAFSMAGGYNGIHQPGVPLTFAIRWTLDNFQTTDETVTYLTKIPHIRGCNFLIADKAGTIARVEACPEKAVACYAENGFGFSLNHYLVPEMKPFEYPTFEGKNGSIRREAHFRQWFETRQSPLTIAHVEQVLSTHKMGVCDHYSLAGQDCETIWSWYSSLGTAEVYVCDGPPCKNSYKLLKYL